MRSKHIIEVLMSLPNWKEVYYDQLGANYQNDQPTKLLWVLFRQGGTLCYILNLLMKNSISYIEPINVEQQSPDFDSKSCKMNVFNFLQACQEDFFIPSDQLFSVSEIYKDDSTVLLRVVKLVEELLSRVDSATWLAPHQTPINSTTAGAKTQRFSIDFSGRSVPSFESDIRSSNSSSILAEDTSIQTTSTTTDLRKKATQELLDTERIYVNQLDILQEIEKDEEKTISQEEIDIIFCNLNELIDFQRFFLIDMEATLTKSSEHQKIGNLFLATITHSKTFAFYYQYVENFEKAVDAVIRNNNDLEKYDYKIPSGQLQSYLIKPIQRICRYHILLREIKKHSDPSSIETQNIIKAHELMKKIAEQVNEEKRRAENLRIVSMLKKNVEDWGMGYSIDSFTPLQLYGIFPIKIDNSEEKQLSIFLFDKAILLGRSSKGVVKPIISNLSLLECIEKNFVTSVLDDSDTSEFKVKIYWHAEKIRWISISFLNEEQYKKWYLALNRLVGRKEYEKKDTPLLISSLPPSKNENSIEKTINRKSKLKRLLGSPNKRNSSSLSTKNTNSLDFVPKDSELLGQETNCENIYKENNRRLLKVVITSTNICKLIPFPSSCTDLLQLKRLLLSTNTILDEKYLFFYRDRQMDKIFLQSNTDLELALEDWFESDNYEGAFPILIEPNDTFSVNPSDI